VVEGTPLLRAHLGKTWIQGSNPCVSARQSNYLFIKWFIAAKGPHTAGLCAFCLSLFCSLRQLLEINTPISPFVIQGVTLFIFFSHPKAAIPHPRF
jgi:hypothetical protein